MANYRHSLILDLAGNLSRQSRTFGRDITRFTGSARRGMATLRVATAAAARGLDRVGNRYTTFLTGAAGVGAVRFVGQLERRFNRLGVQANVSADDIARLKDEVFSVANAPDIHVDPSEITAAIETIVEKTGDLKFARDNIANIGSAIQASGGSGAAIGALTAEFRKFGITTRQDVLANLDTLVRQGKAGAFTIANFAGQGERLVSAYAATGRTGPTAVRELGAVIQIIRQGTGSAEQAATAFEAVIRTLQDADKIKALRARGIEIFEKDQPGVMRSVASIMEDIIRSTKGSAVALSQVFDAEAMRAFNAASGEFKRTGNVESLHQFLAIMGDGRSLMEDSGRIAKDAAGGWQSLVTAGQKFADATIAGPLRDIADAVNAIDPDRLQKIMRGLAIGGAAVGGLIVAAKVVRAGQTIAGALRGGKAGVGDGVKGAGGLGVVNVRVVNWPQTFSRTAGFTGTAGGRGRAGGRLGGLARSGGRLLGRAGGPLALLGAGLSIADTLTDDTATKRQKIGGTGGAVGGAGGALVGAKAGAALGAFGGPLAPLTVPAGAIIGGGVGYLIGEQVGAKVGDEVAKALDEKDRAAPAERNRIDVDINLGGQIPPGTRTDIRSARPTGRLRINQGPVMLTGAP